MSTPRIIALQNQLRAYTTPPDSRVVIEFVRTKTNSINLSPAQIAATLELEEAGLDLTRIGIRVLGQNINPADIVFTAIR